MSALSPLSGANRKLDLRAVRSACDPQRSFEWVTSRNATRRSQIDVLSSHASLRFRTFVWPRDPTPPTADALVLVAPTPRGSRCSTSGCWTQFHPPGTLDRPPVSLIAQSVAGAHAAVAPINHVATSHSNQEMPDEQHAEPAGCSGRRRVDCCSVTGFDALDSSAPTAPHREVAIPFAISPMQGSHHGFARRSNIAVTRSRSTAPPASEARAAGPDGD
jgi:hypothetical protein